MITIPISVSKGSGGTAPFTYTFTSSDTNVTFSESTGTAPLVTGTYTASTDVLYPDQTYISTTTIGCTFVDANGCTQTLSSLVIADPCTLQSTITSNGDYTFIVTTTGGSGSYTYEWNFDEDLFSLNDDSSTDNILSLNLDNIDHSPISTNINVLITDSQGCTLLKTYQHTFCYPTVSSVSIPLVCNGRNPTGCSLINQKSSYSNFNLKTLVAPCTNQVIDWSTLTYNRPVNMCIYHIGNGIINIASSNEGVSTLINYNVYTTKGLPTSGKITVIQPACTNRTSLSGSSDTIQLTIEDIVSDTKTSSVDSRVAGNPNWSTFTFTNTPSFGTVVFNGNRDIVYTITDVATTPTIPDVITWSLQDDDGNQINITDTVLRNRIALPVTTTEIICNSCGETTDPQDLLANDTGDIDRSTATIVLNDPDIIITKATDNNFIFTSLPGASFSNLNSYKVANTQGAFTADQNFIVSVACVGDETNPTKDLTCEVSKTFDILDQYTNTNAFNTTFAETSTTSPDYTTQGGTIVGANGTLDFSAITNGTYTFEFTAENIAACAPAFNDIGVLTVIHGVTPNINLSAATLVSTGVYSFTFTYSGISSGFTVTDDGVAGVFHTGIVANNGSGSFTLYAASGSSVVISAVTVCGNSTTDTTVI